MHIGKRLLRKCWGHEVLGSEWIYGLKMRGCRKWGRADMLLEKSDTILLPLLLIAGCLRANTNAGQSAVDRRNFRLIFRSISARNSHCFRRVFCGAAT